MRKKLLFFLMLFSVGALFAQTDTIKTLIISEARFDRADHAYIELTNVGPTAINLEEFEILSVGAWDPFPDGRLWPTEPHHLDGRHTMLPAGTLAPDESYIIAVFHDEYEENYLRDVYRFGYSQDYGGKTITKPELKALTDLPVHRGEEGSDHDSISVYRYLLESWQGRDAIFVRHYPPGADSCVIDQVGGVFTDADGTNPSGYVDVGGFSQATAYATLVRKHTVTEGELDFLKWSGPTDISESQWIPIPFQREGGDTWEVYRTLFWTVGNHGAYNLDENSLKSTPANHEWALDIDIPNKVITVPWGVRNDDSIMYQIDYSPGMAWHYHYNDGAGSSEDSLALSVRTGDSLTIYVCGDDLDEIKFHLEAAPPTADANWVIPMKRRNADGSAPVAGSVYEVTHGDPVIDTISGIPFGGRADTLLLYLEKAPLASWEFVWVDGNVRTDLMDGDLLRVTAEDNSVKDYYLKVQKYRKARNANLSSITWPDIPEAYKGLFGWVGDTIPEFHPAKTDYKVMVPFTVSGIPGLVAKNEDDNASNVLQRATNMSGSVANRTVTITSTAENDTSVLVYKVLLEKQKNSANIQPWTNANAFISQYTWRTEFANSILEIVNPANIPLDISDYMIYVGSATDPAAAIQYGGGEDDYTNRYRKYIPGYLWKDPGVEVQHSLAYQDVNVNTNVFGGDVFVISDINKSGDDWTNYGYTNQIDVDFKHMESDPDYTGATAVNAWYSFNLYLWKIVGDSIKEGWKPANDPADFELMDVFGPGDGTHHFPCGPGTDGQTYSFTRRPEIYHGNPVFGGSFGETEEASEWTYMNEPRMQDAGYGWPEWRTLLGVGTGSHFMNDVTLYRSTVSSTSYIVSPGYSMEETILGVVDGTSVDDFYLNIIKADVDQTLECIAVADGAALDGTDVLLNGDTLMVTSADGFNVSKYIVEVTAGGLSSDATLTSSTYTVAETGAVGTVTGIDYGTTLRTVVAGVTPAANAAMNIIDDKDQFVPLVKLNFDTMYVDVLATDHIYLEVIAQNGVAKTVYQLIPTSNASDAFVTSDVYLVDQALLMINHVPQGMNVEAFLANLLPAPGATIQLYDKLGYERNEGTLYLDDVLVVTASDGVTTATYLLSVLGMTGTNVAYILSADYSVDQNSLTVSGVTQIESVADFKSKVTTSTGATFEVLDSDGVAKADTDMMAEGDQIVVTAADGVTTTTYIVSVNVGIDNNQGADISIYPNPSEGLVNIAGLEVGSRIRVFNTVGTAVKDLVVYGGVETISLENQSAGMYFITISNDDGVIGQYKVIKK